MASGQWSVVSGQWSVVSGCRVLNVLKSYSKISDADINPLRRVRHNGTTLLCLPANLFAFFERRNQSIDIFLVVISVRADSQFAGTLCHRHVPSVAMFSQDLRIATGQFECDDSGTMFRLVALGADRRAKFQQ